MTGVDRGQAFTLEAVVAALVIVGSVVFALQVASVTANSPSTSSDGTDGHLRGLADGVLEHAAEAGSLRASLLYWDPDREAFHGTADGPYVSSAPPTEFGRLLSAAFDHRTVRFNLDVSYLTSGGDRHTLRVVDHGTPSDGAVRTVEAVTLYDDDRLHDAGEAPTNVTLSEVAETNGSAFYAPDAAPDSPLYNVVHVEVVLWRT